MLNDVKQAFLQSQNIIARKNIRKLSSKNLKKDLT